MNKKIQSLLAERDDAWRFPGTVYDTFTALTQIAHYDKNLLDGKALGAITNTLVSIESAPGGPYYSTFSEDNTHPLIFDRKTNTAIAEFLALYDIELPNLSTFLKQKEQEKKTVLKSTFTDPEVIMMKKIHAQLKKRFAKIDPELRENALFVIERTIQGNPDKQMSLMPYYMQKALGKKASHIPSSLITEMGVANIFFWSAFIIYDDFWDEDEAADPKLLPVANLFARSYSDFFAGLEKQIPGFRKFFERLMDDLDGANAWETAHCRAQRKDGKLEIPQVLPKYESYMRKYRPASGQILGPLALLLLCGYSFTSKEVSNLILYFKHYLIAMQLNDDLHDWEEDLERGHISTALDMLLRDFGAEGTSIDLEKDIENLRATFWFTTLPRATKKALAHARKSKKALQSLKSISDPAPLFPFADLPEKIALQAIREQQSSLDFMSSYSMGKI